AYNDRCFARLYREKAEVMGKHAGLHDLFVPILVQGNVQAVLITGPIATSLPSRIDIVERWRALTGREGHPSDPEFSHFLTVTLSTLTLENDRLALFRQLLGRLAVLMASEGRAERLADEIGVLRQKLAAVRVVERTW